MSPRNKLKNKVMFLMQATMNKQQTYTAPPYSAHLSFLTYCVSNNLLRIRNICDSKDRNINSLLSY